MDEEKTNQVEEVAVSIFRKEIKKYLTSVVVHGKEYVLTHYGYPLAKVTRIPREENEESQDY